MSLNTSRTVETIRGLRVQNNCSGRAPHIHICSLKDCSTNSFSHVYIVFGHKQTVNGISRYFGGSVRVSINPVYSYRYFPECANESLAEAYALSSLLREVRRIGGGARIYISPDTIYENLANHHSLRYYSSSKTWEGVLRVEDYPSKSVIENIASSAQSIIAKHYHICIESFRTPFTDMEQNFRDQIDYNIYHGIKKRLEDPESQPGHTQDWIRRRDMSLYADSNAI